jgi:hypothetical protein
MFHFQCFFFEVLMQISILRTFVLWPMANGLMRLNLYLSNVLKDYVIRSNIKKYGL